MASQDVMLFLVSRCFLTSEILVTFGEMGDGFCVGVDGFGVGVDVGGVFCFDIGLVFMGLMKLFPKIKLIVVCRQK